MWRFINLILYDFIYLIKWKDSYELRKTENFIVNLFAKIFIKAYDTFSKWVYNFAIRVRNDFQRQYFLIFGIDIH